MTDMRIDVLGTRFIMKMMRYRYVNIKIKYNFATLWTNSDLSAFHKTVKKFEKMITT